MIKLNNVKFSYGEKSVLDSFSLEINKGDRICLFGDSGSGKTTALRLILGLETPQMGEIIKNKNLKPSVVFQEDRLIPFKTVLENLTLFGCDIKKATDILTKLGLKDYLYCHPSDLSGGMSRRVAIARALSVHFDFLILDEPFTGLDKTNISACAGLINEILGEKPLILVTHSKEEAEILNCNIKEML
ncbi:MAG: ABC transporter ATP-binding protein [Clostridia bacterium]|nr:ABC transporter ATP-binding protein [Clostridia bacterium]